MSKIFFVICFSSLLFHRLIFSFQQQHCFFSGKSIPLKNGIHETGSRKKMVKDNTTKSKLCAELTRRRIVGSVVTTVVSTFLGDGNIMSPDVVNAMCLTGDTSEQCIGVYKESPDILEHVDKSYTYGLTRPSPIRIPSSYKEALRTLTSLRNDDVDQIHALVQNGKLASAGKKVLKIIPEISLSGNVILESLEEKKINTFELIQDKFRYVEVKLRQCDVLIGQGLRGEMGVSAVAQIMILEDLREFEDELDGFVKVISSLTQ